VQIEKRDMKWDEVTGNRKSRKPLLPFAYEGHSDWTAS
jgi:hypothetical protein